LFTNVDEEIIKGGRSGKDVVNNESNEQLGLDDNQNNDNNNPD